MRKALLLLLCLPFFPGLLSAQTYDALRFFPKGTRLYGNIPYANDTLKKHQLDIYLPDDTREAHPIILWIHSGGWRAGGKQGDLYYMSNTLKALIRAGYAVVAINYRYSTTAIFPAQIRDCNQAMAFIYENARKYKLDRDRVALMGFSAGGHLAALMGLSADSDVPDFYAGSKKPDFRIRAVIDFFGLSDFYLIPAAEYQKTTNGPGLLFGAAMVDKPWLVKEATPLTYIDNAAPPFLIIHGSKDDEMDIRQSITLNDSLRSHGVKTKLMIIRGAPHGGEMFDTDSVRSSVISFLKIYLR